MLALAAAVLGAGYLLWFRDSSLVRVERVAVTGLDTPDGPRVRAELAAAARNMTTLHVDESALQAAVRNEPLVRSLSVESSFPHKLVIQVVENRPVAMLTAGGRELPVAPDGTLLPGARSETSLPAIRLRVLPARGGRIESPSVRLLVAVAGAAPAPLLGRMSFVSREPGRGLVVGLRQGPSIWLGEPVDLAAKWQAAVAVLAQPSSRGASYIDVRMPSRPVAGGLDTSALQGQASAQSPPAGSLPGAPAPISAAPSSTPAPPGIPSPPQPLQAPPAAGTQAQQPSSQPAATAQPQPATGATGASSNPRP